VTIGDILSQEFQNVSSVLFKAINKVTV